MTHCKMPFTSPGQPLVLLIDDDDDHGMALRNTWPAAESSHRLEQARTISEAEAVLTTCSPDLIISLVRFPGGCFKELVPLMPEDSFLVLIGKVDTSPLCTACFPARVFDYVVKNEQYREDLPGLARRWSQLAEQNALRRKSQQQCCLLSKLMEECHLSVVITDAGSEKEAPRIMHVNPAFCRSTGYDHDEVVGRTPDFLRGPNTCPRESQRLEEAIAQRQSFHGELVNYRKDGSEFLLEWHIDPVRDAAGQVTHWVSRQEDITDQRAREIRLRQLERQIASLSELNAMAELTASIAHDVSQPLTAICNYCETCVQGLASGKLDNAALRGVLHKLGNEAQLANAVIERVRQSLRRDQPQLAAHSLQEIVDEVEALLAHRELAPNVELRMEHADAALAVVCDRRQIQHVLLNLVLNASQAASTCDRPVTIVVRSELAEDGTVRMTVEDNGPGVSSEAVEQLFKPFYSTKPEGLGLGLPVCRGIIAEHGGTMTAHRKMDQGLTMTFTLPLRKSS